LDQITLQVQLEPEGVFPVDWKPHPQEQIQAQAVPLSSSGSSKGPSQGGGTLVFYLSPFSEENVRIEVRTERSEMRGGSLSQASTLGLAERCVIQRGALAKSLGLVLADPQVLSLETWKRVGFDLDDTLAFTSLSFHYPKRLYPRWISLEAFFEKAAERIHLSWVKAGVKKVFDRLRRQGAEVFVITARDPYGIRQIQEYLNQNFQIAAGQVHIEPKGKTERIRQLALDAYFGDSDGDIQAALQAQVVPVRVLRSPHSSLRSAGPVVSFFDYHPGWFGEQILEDSYN
jgi:acid phosphatase class B